MWKLQSPTPRLCRLPSRLRPPRERRVGSSVQHPPPFSHLLCANRAGQSARQVFEALEIVHGPEVIDMGQHGPDATRSWLEAFIAQEGIEPHKAAATLAQPLDFAAETLGALAVEAIADQQHHRALAQHAA